MKRICKFCKYYRPDERYKGVVGWCDKYDSASDIEYDCCDFKEGKQKWMNGEEVKE